ncbi:hypothetical protein NDA13_005662 [Ustilago tritici]|nr:hypothetical protein NDA13_005662 [Ustilago tritici]
MDISLFERLVHPNENENRAVPFVTLEIQRRMHPFISTLIRSTLYPDLQDDPAVAKYPKVSGMRRRLFWLDHREAEDSGKDRSDSTSHTNRFAEVIINDRDIDEMALNSDDEDDDEAQGASSRVTKARQPPRLGVHKSTLLQALRLATVDNFQGEEAKVVIISLVRSNEQRKFGFLRTSNRINVLLSRAQHGMYIIGNSETYAHIPMWGDVLEMLNKDGNLGPHLELCCPRHSETPLQITTPDDFSIVSPEAGCDLLCGQRLPCGHSCVNKCHSDGMHQSTYCLKPCNRAKEGCSHNCHERCDCPSVCGADCPPATSCQICSSDDVKALQADLIMFTTYGEIDISEKPCMFLPCDHIFTVESLDGVIAMSDYYELDSLKGAPTALKGTVAAFSQEEMKTCPTCRASLRLLPRYGRIVRRALLDQSTKKFIAWAHRRYRQFAKCMQFEQGKLIDTRSDVHLRYPVKIVLARKGHVEVLNELNGLGGRYRGLAYLRRKLDAFLKQTEAEEQPFRRVYDIVETLRRRRLADGHTIDAFEYDQDVLQTRGALLAMSLAIRCEIVAVVDFIAVYYAQPSNEGRSLTLDFSGDRERCEMIVKEAESTKNILQQTEAHIFWAQLAGLECEVMEKGETDGFYDEIRVVASSHLDSARELCETYPGQTRSVVDEVREVRRLLDQGGYESQMRMVVSAMSKEFSGTGHWYRCANGHPFTVGECGLPMETTRCPQCNAPIGGQNHTPAAGVQAAGDIERQFGNLSVAE